MDKIRLGFGLLLGLALGVVGASLLIADATGTNLVERGLVLFNFFVISAGVVSFVSGGRVMAAFLVAWGAVVMGGLALYNSLGKGLPEIGMSFGLLLLPVILTWFGGKLGKAFGDKWRRAGSQGE